MSDQLRAYPATVQWARTVCQPLARHNERSRGDGESGNLPWPCWLPSVDVQLPTAGHLGCCPWRVLPLLPVIHFPHLLCHSLPHPSFLLWPRPSSSQQLVMLSPQALLVPSLGPLCFIQRSAVVREVVCSPLSTVISRWIYRMVFIVFVLLGFPTNPLRKVLFLSLFYR